MAEDTKTMTREELDAFVADAAARAVGDPAKLETLVAPLVDRYLQSNGVKATITEIISAADKARQKQNDPMFFTRLALDSLNVREGRKPECGTNFDELARLAGEYHQRTGVAAGASNSAGNFVPQEYSGDWINLVYRDSPLLSRCRRHPMATDSMLIPTLTGGVTVSWTPETTNTSSMGSQATGQKPETQITTGQQTLTRYCAHARVYVTRKALRITNPAIEDVLRTDIPRAIEAACSKAILDGTATPASDPVSGLNTLVTTNVKTWNVGDNLRGLVDFIQAPGIQLGSIATPDAVVAGPGAISKLMSMQDGQNRAYFNFPQTGMPGNMAGMPLIQDFNIPSTYGGGQTDSRMYVGNWARHAHISLSEGMFVQVNPYSYSINNLVEFLFEIYFGFVPSNEKCFAYMNVPTA